MGLKQGGLCIGRSAAAIIKIGFFRVSHEGVPLERVSLKISCPCDIVQETRCNQREVFFAGLFQTDVPTRFRPNMGISGITSAQKLKMAA